ncbi:MAG: hypothetical protein P4M07_09490 [Xanthobacteraceae bacterium]|nr:hypothetical protein [Xanthobacteraceae bacterium]
MSYAAFLLLPHLAIGNAFKSQGPQPLDQRRQVVGDMPVGLVLAFQDQALLAQPGD